MRKIRVAQIGTGHDHAADIIKTLKMQSDVYDLVGYAKVFEDSENIGDFAYEGHKERYADVREMTVDEILAMPDLDAVCIETEDRALTKYALMAAERGLNIHMDKPGGIESEDFERLVDIAEAKNLVLHMGYMYRYNAAILKLRDELEKGKLGEVHAVEAQMNCSHGLEKRNWLGNYPGGMLYFLGCHMIDLVYSIMGEPEEVIPLSTSSKLDGTEADDFGMAVFRYKNGVSFAKSSAVEIGGFERRQLVVCGSRGTIEINPLEFNDGTSSEIFVPTSSIFKEVSAEEGTRKFSTEARGRYDAMMRAFAEYVRGEKENPFGYEYERGLHRLILKACGYTEKEIVG